MRALARWPSGINGLCCCGLSHNRGKAYITSIGAGPPGSAANERGKRSTTIAVFRSTDDMQGRFRRYRPRARSSSGHSREPRCGRHSAPQGHGASALISSTRFDLCPACRRIYTIVTRYCRTPRLCALVFSACWIIWLVHRFQETKMVSRTVVLCINASASGWAKHVRKPFSRPH